MTLAAAAISAAVATSATAGFKPTLGKYTASTPGTSATNSLAMEVIRKSKRTLTTRVLTVTDDCGAALFPAPFSLGRLFAKDFKYQGSGVSGSTNFTIDIDGLFTNATTATAQVKSTSSQMLLPPSQPVTCRDDTTFTLKYAGGKKKKGKG